MDRTERRRGIEPARQIDFYNAFREKSLSPLSFVRKLVSCHPPRIYWLRRARAKEENGLTKRSSFPLSIPLPPSFLSFLPDSMSIHNLPCA